jgi:molybdopterin molybdotransferase
MIPLEKALKTVLENLPKGGLGTQTVTPDRANGRILVADALSGLEVPPFDRVTMDGYALAEGERSRSVELVGEVRAGQAPSLAVRPGTAIKVMTGAPAPAGTDRVVPVELTEAVGGKIHILDDHRGPRNIAPRGQDLRRGEVVIPAGKRLDAVRIACLIAAGVEQVQVSPLPRVAVLATGDELSEDPVKRREGQIPNSNSPLLREMFEARGYPVTITPALPDDVAETTAQIGAALAEADLLVLTGGVSVGDYDCVPRALEKLGLKILVSRVALKPGKPFTFAVGKRGVVFGLPGNPVSVFVTAHLFVLPALAWLEGAGQKPRFFSLPLAETLECRPTSRARLLPARLSGSGQVVPLLYHGSGHLQALAHADGLIRLDPGVKTLPEGTNVAFWPIRVEAFHVG